MREIDGAGSNITRGCERGSAYVSLWVAVWRHVIQIPSVRHGSESSCDSRCGVSKGLLILFSRKCIINKIRDLSTIIGDIEYIL